MRLKQYITEQTFNNWVKYTRESLKWDWEEYKKKEDYKWKGRMANIDGRWPIFDSIQHLKKELDKSKVVNLDKIRSSVGWTDIDDIHGLKGLVNSYKRPRDVDRIVKGYESNAKIPMPIVLKSGNNYWPLAGNTRQNTASIMGIPVKVHVIDVKEK
jgi:hypothetical protein